MKKSVKQLCLCYKRHRKNLIIMRNTILIVLISVLQTFATISYSQSTKLSLNLKDSSIKEVLAEIENKSEFYFLYNSELIDVKRHVDIVVENRKIEDILSQLFSPSDVNISIKDRHIVLTPVQQAVQQQKNITGKIIGSSGEPIPGVTITVKGSTTGTISDSNGNYSLNDVAEGKTIIFSFVGMKSQQLVVGKQANINITMEEETIGVDEVVVIGYGVQKKANLTGSVGSISGEKLAARPATNAGNLIQGRISGLQVTQPSAEPGRDNPDFLIRGRGSFGGSNSPLVLIDGVTGSFNNLSPDDIENVTLLKDAASASIYGARAANGVILVTTKKGKKGEPTISYRGNIGVHSPTAMPDLITNSAEYMEMYNKAAARSGVAFRYAQEEIDKYKNATDRNKYPNFDNIGYYFNPAVVTNHNLSLSGGGDKNVYNLSLGYLDQNAMLPGYKFKKYNALINYTNEISKFVSVGTSINMTYKDRHEPPFTGQNMALSVYAAGPLYGPFLPDGTGRVVSRAYLNEGRNRNPQEYYAMGYQDTKEYNINAQATLDVKPFKGLVWSSKVAVNYIDEYYKMHQKPYQAYVLQEQDPATNDYRMYTFGPDILGVTDQYAKSITPTIFSTLTYETKIKENHNLRVLAGYEQLSYKYQYLRARRINSVDPNITDLTGYTADNQSLYFTHPRLPSVTDPSEWAMQSLFSRINYDYQGKYLFEVDMRYDGTSKVSPSYRWGFFPSMSAGWLVSEENFMKSINWISSLKLRGSYGTLGNQDVGTYLYQDVLTINNVYYPYGNSALTQGGVINVFKDQSLKWESTRVVDYGFDLNVYKGLLGVTFDWYRKTTFDILAAQPVPASLGLSSPTLNDGEMQNQGLELELTHQNKIGEISYGVNFLISSAKNKLLKIRVPSKGTSINEVGLPYGSYYLYEWDGIFQVEDIGNANVPKHKLNPNPKAGDLKMKDQNADGIVDENDRIVVDGAYPDYIYSFGFNVGYKRFTLTGFFQGVQGLKTRLNNWGVDPFMQGTAPTTEWRNAWTPENRNNTLPAIYVAGYTGVANYVGSTYYMQDASYLRMKNVMLSYDFPKQLISRLKAKELNVYVSADNLFTITKFKGGDPERTSLTGNLAQYPQARILNFGLNVKF